MPGGFLVQRHQSFILARHQITGYNGVEETHTDDGSSFKVRLSRGLHKGAKVQHEVLFKTSFDDTANRMLSRVPLKSVVKNLVADSKAAAAQSASSSSSRPQVLSDF